MKNKAFTLILLAMLAALLLSACGTQNVVPEQVQAPTTDQNTAPPQADNTEDDGGPVRLVGSINYTDFSIPMVMESPSPALLDMVYIVQGDNTKWAPMESQILGKMTSPVSPPPLSYTISLPREPKGTYLDVDNDGEEDQGVQIFRLAMASNINGDSYLNQLDQKADLNSYLTDPISGQITEGSLLIYAADNQQAFPTGFGDDGILFTEDDPVAPVAQGYTVVHFGPEGFTFDRSREAQLNVLEAGQAASPDFSDQGLVESYNSLIDHLSTHYSYTDLRNLDWEAIRAEYLPKVEDAEKMAADQPEVGIGMFAYALHTMAQSIRDAHVFAAITDPAHIVAYAISSELQNQPIATNIGANTVELDDGRIIITDVIPESPAAKAGLVFGTEVVSVNGKPVEEVIPTVVYNKNVGTETAQRLYQVANLLKFPAPDEDGNVADVTIEVKLPDTDAVQSLTLTPGEYMLPDPLAREEHEMPISYRLDPTYGYLTWENFETPVVMMAVQEKFLSEAKETNQQGVILDLRGNGGGWDNLYFTMASYFFNEENPVSMHWLDEDVYDSEIGDLVRSAPDEHLLSAPRPELYFDGDVVILVDNNCASSCEFFTQFLQYNNRATVVAQYPTEGAGGSINRVNMPYGIIFQYTKGRYYFAGTDELNLEAKGVTPDVKVPVTEETEMAKRQGGDPVLDAGIATLNKSAFQNLELQSATYADGVITSVAPVGWTYNSSIQGYASPDSQSLISLIYAEKLDGVTDPDQIAAAILPEVNKIGEIEAKSGVWSVYAMDGKSILFTANIDGKPFIGQMNAPDADSLATLVEVLLQPALDAFEVTQP